MSEANLTQASSGVFSIHGKGLKLTSAEDAEPYVKALHEMGQEVNRIHLGGNTLGIEACEALAKVIATKSNLEIADFADIFTGRLISEIPQALQALCDSLAGLTKLIEVDLSDNAFGGRVAEPMVNFLTKNMTFETLRLTNNGMGPSGGSVIASAILSNAKKSSTTPPTGEAKITRVICGRNRLENGSAPLFADAYAALGPSLKEVRMVQNGIRMEGIASLAKGLRKCPNLEVLDLQDNTAAIVGSRAIASSLKYWPNLIELNLSDCLLRPKGALLIMEALKEGHNQKLEILKLQSDEVDAKAVEVLADAVRLHLKKLSVVELNGNRVEADDESMVKLREALEANGFEDAIDEIDDVEEVDEEEEEEEEEELESEDEDEQNELHEKVLLGKVETGGEDVRADEADVVRQDKAAEIAEPHQQADKKEDDELAKMMEKVGI